MSRSRPRLESRRGRRGFALLVVLWFLVLLAAVGTYLMANARSETALAHNILAGAKAEALADAGIAQTVFNLTDPVPGNRWQLDGAPHQMRLPDGELIIRLDDESKKINPNLASESLTAGLFESLGVDHNQARRLGAAIADWVDTDDQARPNGAEKDQYRAAGRSYAPPNVPFESLDELQLVLGMTPEIFAAARPYLTPYSDLESPDAKTAPDPIRRALSIAAQAVAEGDQGDAAGGDSGTAAASNEAAPSAQNSSPNRTQNPAQNSGQNSNAGDNPVVADVDITARSSEGGVFVRHAVLRIDADNPKGYVVLDWRRGDLAE